MTTTKVKTNYYIPQINSAKIERATETSASGTVIVRDGEYISISNSLELIYMTETYPEEFKDGYTDIIVSVTFASDIKEEMEKHFNNYLEDGVLTEKTITTWGVTTSRKVMRNKYSADGFIMIKDGVEQKYVEYKRTTSESRVGTALYIKEQYYDDMIRWSRLNISEEDVKDIPAFRSYESLVLSSIEATIDIKPENILLVNEEMSDKFMWAMSVTRLDGDKLIVNDEEVEVENSLWDGEALLDSSCFVDEYEGHGFMLLRNHFTKTAAFNTNIQQFCADNGITTVTDMFGVEHNVEDIKLILNPTCIKLFKFKNIFGGMKETWDYLLANLIPYFGICKTDHESKFGSYQNFTYQFLNSLPFDEADLRAMLTDDLKYLDALKNDDRVFKMDLGGSHNSQTPTTKDMLIDLMEINPDIQYTNIFKTVRKDRTDNFTRALRRGKIKMPYSDNSTLFGNPYEYLHFAIFGNREWVQPLEGWSVYCPRYNDGEEVAMFRSPHIATGNVMFATNRTHELLDRYFNLSNNIVVINSIGVPVLDCLQGADFDSDFALMCREPHVLARAKEVNGKFLIPKNAVPTNKIDGYTFADCAKIDNKIADNKIGSICNLAQVLQSYYWTLYFANREDKRLAEVTGLISKLSSLSQLEIDKSKKYFSFSMSKMLQSITEEAIELGLPVEEKQKKVLSAEKAERYKELVADGSEEAQHQIKMMLLSERIKKPSFFQYIQPDVKASFSDEFNCPMCTLQLIIDEQKKASRTKKMEAEQILTIMDANKANREQINKIYAAMKATKEAVNYIAFQTRSKSINALEARQRTEAAINNLFIEEVKKIKVSEATMCRMIEQLSFWSDAKKKKSDLNGLGSQALGWLYGTFKDRFLPCIKQSEEPIEVLVEVLDGDYDLEFYGVHYKRVLQKPTATLN